MIEFVAPTMQLVTPKKALKELTPQNYVGLALELTERTIEEIKSPRNS